MKALRSQLRVLALEDRLTPAWAGVAPAYVPPPTAATAVTAPGTGAAAITANEVDYYTFVPAATGSYTITTATPNSSLDTVLGVFAATGARVASNDDIVTYFNTDSSITVTLAAGARYYVGVTNYTGSVGGSYTWTIAVPTAAPVTDDAYENNDTQATATNLGTPTTTTTLPGLVLADSADWYRFTTTATGTAASAVSIAFNTASGNLALAVYNAAGTQVLASDGTGNGEAVSLTGLAAGTYSVRVTGAANPSYTLTVVPPVATTPPPTTPPATGGFDIVIRVNGLTASQQAIFEQAAARWESIIVGDVPNATYQGVAVDDILIDASGVAIDGAYGVLGQAGPDAVRSGSYLPIHGTMRFDTADLARLEANGQLLAVIEHEMGHVLGIGTIWQQKGLLTGAGTTDPRFTGAQAVAAYNAIFGTTLTSVPVEGLPSGAGSRDSHWRESVFTSELMTPVLTGAVNAISRVTVASLADIGYVVNLTAADNFTPTAAAAILATTPTTGSAAVTAATASVVPATAATDADEPVGSPAGGAADGGCAQRAARPTTVGEFRDWLAAWAGV